MLQQLTGMVLALSLMAGVAHAAVLSDFESDDDIATWRLRAPGTDKLVRSEQFATSGVSSMKFTTPAWKEGKEQWPAFEGKPSVSDWQGYDRLCVDITNPNAERYFLSMFISDSKVEFRNGLNFRFELPSRGFKRYMIPLKFPEAINVADISIIHVFTQRPGTDMEVYIDNMRLLKPGEKLADPPGTFVKQVGALFAGELDDFDGVLAECRNVLYTLAKNPAQRQRADDRLAQLAARRDEIRRELQSGEITLADLENLTSDLAKATGSPDRIVSAFRLESDFSDLFGTDNPMLVGFASSMEKLLPRDMPFEVKASRNVQIALARNEKESFQVAVMPRGERLKGVSVSAGDLKSAAGDTLSASDINCDVMGYVETKTRPPYAVSYIGWWPDPILDFLGPIDIAEGDLQSFWVRVNAPKEQPAGVYKGTLTVSAQDAEPLTFDLSVRVYDFTLPSHTSLPTAITFFERVGKMGGEANWPEMKLEWADFLADYQIDYDSLYRQGPPDYEIIQHLHDQGRLVAFNLGNVFNGGTSAEGFDKAIAATVERIRPAYEEAKQRGVLDHAYIYGFDERPQEQFGLLEQSAQALRKAFPEVLLMTTSYDNTYGTGSVVKTMEAWCPLTPRFNLETAAEARAAGKKVWWYICCGPHNPFANWFVEYAAIESRLLMGAMTAKYRPDGFLYYSLSIWNQNEPIESGPFTEWDPVSWTVYHGDGSLLCSGPGGKPVPTIRLENYRDGMEDFAYACILEDIIKQYEAKGNALTATQKRWLREAKAAITVPDELVNTMAEYSRDPEALYAYRNRLGELIDASGMPDANPWGDNFGARGFPTK